MPGFLLAIGGFFKGLPWQVYVAAAFLALLPLSYCKGKSDGKQHMIDVYKQAEIEAKERSIRAANAADSKQEQAQAAFDEEQRIIREEIRRAEQSGDNVLDAIFGGV